MPFIFSWEISPTVASLFMKRDECTGAILLSDSESARAALADDKGRSFIWKRKVITKRNDWTSCKVNGHYHSVTDMEGKVIPALTGVMGTYHFRAGVLHSEHIDPRSGYRAPSIETSNKVAWLTNGEYDRYEKDQYGMYLPALYQEDYGFIDHIAIEKGESEGKNIFNTVSSGYYYIKGVYGLPAKPEYARQYVDKSTIYHLGLHDYSYELIHTFNINYISYLSAVPEKLMVEVKKKLIEHIIHCPEVLFEDGGETLAIIYYYTFNSAYITYYSDEERERIRSILLSYLE